MLTPARVCRGVGDGLPRSRTGGYAPRRRTAAIVPHRHWVLARGAVAAVPYRRLGNALVRARRDAVATRRSNSAVFDRLPRRSGGNHAADWLLRRVRVAARLRVGTPVDSFLGHGLAQDNAA